MAEVVEASTEGSVEKTAEALDRGDLAVIPTDTVYGVAGRPDLPQATARIFETKKRSRDLTLPVLTPDIDAAAGVGAFDRRARALAEAFWPGGLTLVLRRTEASHAWDLGREESTVGVRVPAHPTAVELLALTGPLAVTSANRSGEPAAATCEEAQAALGGTVAVYLCGAAGGGTASTVVDLTGDSPRVLRVGAVPAEEVLARLGLAGG